MKRSTDRILTTHAGSLPRPPGLKEMVLAKSNGQAYDENAPTQLVRGVVDEVVRRQIESGIDIVNGGELSKSNFMNYARERLGGFEMR